MLRSNVLMACHSDDASQNTTQRTEIEDTDSTEIAYYYLTETYNP